MHSIDLYRLAHARTDDKGNLQPFEERFERMIAWQARRTPDAGRAELEKATLAFMAKMPAWKDHPRVRGG